MTDDRTALIEALRKADDGSFLRAVAGTVLHVLVEASTEGVIGAGRYERSGDRSAATQAFTLRSKMRRNRSAPRWTRPSATCRPTGPPQSGAARSCTAPTRSNA